LFFTLYPCNTSPKLGRLFESNPVLRIRIGKVVYLIGSILFWILFTAFLFLDHAFEHVYSTLSKGVQNSGHLTFFTGFIIGMALYLRQTFLEVERFEVVPFLWRLFIIGMMGVSGLLFFILGNRILDTYSTSGVTRYLDPIFFSASLYIVITYFLAAIFAYRRFVLYQKTRRKLLGWYILIALIAIGLVFAIVPIQFPSGFLPVWFLFFFIACVVVSTNVEWIAYLNFQQKLRALGLFILMTLISLAYYIAIQRMSQQFEISWVPSHYLFTIYVMVFPSIYTLFSILFLIFNLPTASLFERRSSEVASLNKINQAILSNLNFDEILETLLDASLLVSNASVGWIEVSIKEDNQPKEFRLGKGIDEEAKLFTAHTRLRYDVLKRHSPLYIRNIHRNNVYKRLSTRYRTLLGVPILKDGSEYGVLFILKELTNSLEEASINSIQSFAEQAGIAIKNVRLIQKSITLERYHEQLKIAKEVQTQLLPADLPAHPAVEFAAIYETADEVGGDYFDIAHNQSDVFRLAIGDVSGKGTTAAFYMAEIKGIFHALTLMDMTPKEFIICANKAFSTCLQKGAFMTLTYLQIDCQEQKIEMIRAGHCPAYYYRAESDTVCMMRQGTLGLGIVRTVNFDRYVRSSDSITYQSGDFLVLYTDGITEAKNDDREEFGYERLQAVIEAYRNEAADVLAKAILDEVKRFTTGSLQDDSTVLIVKFT